MHCIGLLMVMSRLSLNIWKSFFDVSEEKEYEWMLLGDMNLNTHRARNRKLKLYNDFKNCLSLKSLINIPTRLDNNNDLSTCLDHILVNRHDFYVNSGIVALTVSDHLPVFCFRKRAEKPQDFVYIKARSYKSFSDDVFAESISNAD